MKKLLLIFFSLCLFATIEGQMIIRASAPARAQASGPSYGPELNPDVPCENTAYWYEFGSCLAQAGGMTLVGADDDDYVVSNPNTGWDASGTFHIKITVDNYSGAGSGLKVTYGDDVSVSNIMTNGTFEYNATATNGNGIYIGIWGASCRITYLSIKKVL